MKFKKWLTRGALMLGGVGALGGGIKHAAESPDTEPKLTVMDEGFAEMQVEKQKLNDFVGQIQDIDVSNIKTADAKMIAILKINIKDKAFESAKDDPSLKHIALLGKDVAQSKLVEIKELSF